MLGLAWQCQITEHTNVRKFALDQIGNVYTSGGQTCLMDDIQQVGDNHLGFCTIVMQMRLKLCQRGGGITVECCPQNAK